MKVAIESLLADEPRRQVLASQAQKDVEQLTWVKREEKVMLGFTNEEWFFG
jgi:hypothetical protein